MANSTRKRSRTQSAEPRRGLALLLDESDLARPDTRHAALAPCCSGVMQTRCYGDTKHPPLLGCLPRSFHAASQLALPLCRYLLVTLEVCTAMVLMAGKAVIAFGVARDLLAGDILHVVG